MHTDPTTVIDPHRTLAVVNAVRAIMLSKHELAEARIESIIC